MATKRTPLIITVLRSGGEYKPEHVQWLHKQFPKGYKSACLTDLVIHGITTIPLQYNWPGWWSKLELFRPDIKDDLLYIDLDTVITGDISELVSATNGNTTVLQDFYQGGDQIGSGLMYISKNDKNEIWKEFTSNPEQHMQRCVTREYWGDQGFLQPFFAASQRWQRIIPDAVISYKKHIARKGLYARATGDGTVPHGTKIVCFHGNPRPWQIKQNWIPSIKF